MKKEQKVVSLTEIKELVQKKGYFKYSRQCKEEGDNSIQAYYSLSSGEVKDIFEDDRLKGIRRSLERTVVFAEDINASTNSFDSDVVAIVSTVENSEPEENESEDEVDEEFDQSDYTNEESDEPFEESIIPSDNSEAEENNQEKFQNEEEFEEQDEEVIIDY